MNLGCFNKQQTIENLGIQGVQNAHYNLLEPALIQASLARGEGELGKGGTLLVSTGKFSGRSPRDKFTVMEPSVKDNIWWENNPPIEKDAFEELRKDMFSYLRDRDVFVQDLYAGAEPAHRVNIRQIHELAWHNLFIRHMLRRPDATELDTFVPEFTIVNCPGFAADPKKHGCRSSTVIAVSFEEKLVLIGGTGYGGENKKSVFSILNYLLPEKNIMPMHCSANHAIGDPDDTAIFFDYQALVKQLFQQIQTECFWAMMSTVGRKILHSTLKVVVMQRQSILKKKPNQRFSPRPQSLAQSLKTWFTIRTPKSLILMMIVFRLICVVHIQCITSQMRQKERLVDNQKISLC